MKKRNVVISIAVIAFVVSGIIVAVRLHQGHCLLCPSSGLKPQSVRHFIEGFGSWAILVYIILYTINTLTLLPPIAFMSLSAGALFGPIWGTVALTLGAFIGTTMTFVVSRFLGGKFVEKLVKGKAARFNEKISRNGFLVLLPMRLIGFPPYEFVNYASGLSGISYRDYISATMIGMFPAIVIQVLLADRFVHFSWKDPVLYVAAALFIAMGVITGKIIRNQKKDAGEKANGQI